MMLVLRGRLIPWGRPGSPSPSVLPDTALFDLTELEYSLGSPEVVPSFPEMVKNVEKSLYICMYRYSHLNYKLDLVQFWIKDL